MKEENPFEQMLALCAREQGLEAHWRLYQRHHAAWQRQQAHCLHLLRESAVVGATARSLRLAPADVERLFLLAYALTEYSFRRTVRLSRHSTAQLLRLVREARRRGEGVLLFEGPEGRLPLPVEVVDDVVRALRRHVAEGRGEERAVVERRRLWPEGALPLHRLKFMLSLCDDVLSRWLDACPEARWQGLKGDFLGVLGYVAGYVTDASFYTHRQPLGPDGLLLPVKGTARRLRNLLRRVDPHPDLRRSRTHFSAAGVADPN